MTTNYWKTFIIVSIVFYVENRAFARVIIDDKSEVIGNDTQLLHLDDENRNLFNFEDLFVKFMDRVELFHGYNAEEHKLKSEDGYHLVLHRISGGPNNPPSKGKRVVYVQHGILMSSDQFVVNGPGKDFVYLLVDAGYDVWLGNIRGNSYSRSHESISPDNNTFWQYSYHETAVYDVKAFIDYILNVTEQEKFVYIGFSLGTLMGYTLFSSLPQYNDKVDLIVSLGTVALWHHNNDIRCVLFRNVMQIVEKINNILNIHEYLPKPHFLNRLTVNLCESVSFFKRLICRLLFSMMMPKMDLKRMPTGTLRTMLKTFPSGTSAKNLFHLGQNLRSGDFRAYDYGKLNMEKYGSEVPPKYPLHKIKAPVAIYYGLNDLFSNVDDLKDLRSQLPNVIVFQKIDDEEFSHFDVVLNGKAKEALFSHFIKLISAVRS